MITVDLIVGCRPNFVKAAAICEAAKSFPNIQIRLLHTGQHFGKMSDPFFQELELPEPFHYARFDFQKYNPITRIGMMMADLDTCWTIKGCPNYVMVVGDTDSTLAGALAAKKAKLKVIHVEAGLRCGDDQMQEELNRRLIDSVADLMYTTSPRASDNLLREGRERWKVNFAGNVMADTLYKYIDVARNKYKNERGNYVLWTLHRAENIDDLDRWNQIFDAMIAVAEKIPVVFPKHPRGHVKVYNIPGLTMVEPMGYLEFLAAMYYSAAVVTDSGGVQEETTLLGVPCVTTRDNTERPETVMHGTNVIAGNSADSIRREVFYALNRKASVFIVPEKWEGRAAYRILQDLEDRQ
jgi:UDP-N-acetylglucosamine 2-epimerase (non-hydrolysing)